MSTTESALRANIAKLQNTLRDAKRLKKELSDKIKLLDAQMEKARAFNKKTGPNLL